MITFNKLESLPQDENGYAQGQSLRSSAMFIADGATLDFAQTPKECNVSASLVPSLQKYITLRWSFGSQVSAALL